MNILKQKGLIDESTATNFGILLGLVLMTWTIFSVRETLNFFYYFQNLTIVLGGIITATLISFPISQVLGVFESFWVVLSGKVNLDHNKVISESVVLAIKCREVDSLTDARYILEEERKNLNHPFLRDGVALIAGGYTTQMIKETMETSIQNRSARESNQVKILQSMAKFSFGFGILGSLIMLTQTLSALANEAPLLGTGLANSLMPTFYGLLFAFLIFYPMAEKLETQRVKNMVHLNMVMMAILLLHSRHHALYIEGVLNSFLSPGDRLTRFNKKGKFTGKLSLEKAGWSKRLFRSKRSIEPFSSTLKTDIQTNTRDLKDE